MSVLLIELRLHVPSKAVAGGLNAPLIHSDPLAQGVRGQGEQRFGHPSCCIAPSLLWRPNYRLRNPTS